MTALRDGLSDASGSNALPKDRIDKRRLADPRLAEDGQVEAAEQIGLPVKLASERIGEPLGHMLRLRQHGTGLESESTRCWITLLN